MQQPYDPLLRIYPKKWRIVSTQNLYIVYISFISNILKLETTQMSFNSNG
jgi:hypothetical protein